MLFFENGLIFCLLVIIMLTVLSEKSWCFVNKELRSLQTAVRYFVAFWKSEIRRPRRDREERERERERARDPVAIVAKIGKD